MNEIAPPKKLIPCTVEKRLFGQALVLFMLCLAAYSNALDHSFMMDDGDLFPRVQSLKLDFSAQSIFTHHLNGLYRPLPDLFLKLSVTLLGRNAAAYHVLNLCLYFLVCFLFLLIAGKWILFSGRQTQAMAFAAAALYGVHPLNNMIVNYKTASMLAVYVLCSQASYLNFLFYLEGKRRWHYGLSVFFYLCALFSHEVSAVLPVFMWLTYLYFKPQEIKKDLLPFLRPYAICFIFYTLTYIEFSAFHPTLNGLWQISFPDYIGSMAKLLQWYAMKLLVPVNFLFLWNVPVKGAFSPSALAALFMMVGAAAALFGLFAAAHKRLEPFLLSFFLCGFIPLMFAGFVHTPLSGNAVLEPHWFYFPSMGIFMLAAVLLFDLSRRLNTSIKIMVFAGMVLVLTVMTRESNKVWKDTETYCSYWVKLNHFSYMPVFYMLRLQLDKPAIQGCENGRTDKCGRFIRRFTDSNPGPYNYIQLSEAFYYSHAPKTALHVLKRCMELYPGFAKAYLTAGMILLRQGHYRASIGLWQRGLAIDPGESQFISNINTVKAFMNKHGLLKPYV